MVMYVRLPVVAVRSPRIRPNKLKIVDCKLQNAFGVTIINYRLTIFNFQFVYG